GGGADGRLYIRRVIWIQLLHLEEEEAARESTKRHNNA
ncbi:hypothetical protein A2U01_0071631, partial [Trifolium medium]|nr:hypothetical protein [Trifolium medium]